MRTFNNYMARLMLETLVRFCWQLRWPTDERAARAVARRLHWMFVETAACMGASMDIVCNRIAVAILPPLSDSMRVAFYALQFHTTSSLLPHSDAPLAYAVATSTYFGSAPRPTGDTWLPATCHSRHVLNNAAIQVSTPGARRPTVTTVQLGNRTWFIFLMAFYARWTPASAWEVARRHFATEHTVLCEFVDTIPPDVRRISVVLADMDAFS